MANTAIFGLNLARRMAIPAGLTILIWAGGLQPIQCGAAEIRGANDQALQTGQRQTRCRRPPGWIEYVLYTIEAKRRGWQHVRSKASQLERQ